MTSRQFAEWRAAYRLDPWGEERADLRNGIACSAITKGAMPPADFMPDFLEEKKPKRLTPKEAAAALMAWTAMAGGKIKHATDQ